MGYDQDKFWSCDNCMQGYYNALEASPIYVTGGYLACSERCETALENRERAREASRPLPSNVTNCDNCGKRGSAIFRPIRCSDGRIACKESCAASIEREAALNQVDKVARQVASNPELSAKCFVCSQVFFPKYAGYDLPSGVQVCSRACMNEELGKFRKPEPPVTPEVYTCAICTRNFFPNMLGYKTNSGLVVCSRSCADKENGRILELLAQRINSVPKPKPKKEKVKASPVPSPAPASPKQEPLDDLASRFSNLDFGDGD